MTTNPIFMLAKLNGIVADCDKLQERINEARNISPEDENYQFQLDTAQVRLDIRRLQVEILLNAIPDTN